MVTLNLLPKKACSRCKRVLLISMFANDSRHTFDGKRSDCKNCRDTYNKQYYKLNRGDIQQYAKIQYRCNKDIISKRIRAYERIQLDTNPEYKLRQNLRNRLRMALHGNFKSGSAINDLGCTISEFRAHMEAQWHSGMSWTNYGNGHNKWNLDHIIALANFDLSDIIQIKKAVHYTNIQPIWHDENISKSNFMPKGRVGGRGW